MPYHEPITNQFVSKYALLHSYEYPSKVFPTTCTQEDVGKDVLPDLLKDFWSEKNCMIFAYGQTGTGARCPVSIRRPPSLWLHPCPCFLLTQTSSDREFFRRQNDDHVRVSGEVRNDVGSKHIRGLP